MKAVLRLLVFVGTWPLLIGHGIGTLPWEEEYVPEPCTETPRVRDFHVDSPCLKGTIEVKTHDCTAASVQLPNGELAGDERRGDGDVVIFPLDEGLSCRADFASKELHCEQCLVDDLGEWKCEQEVCVGTLRYVPVENPPDQDAGAAQADAGEPDDGGVDGGVAPSDAGQSDGAVVDGGSDAGADAGVDAAIVNR